MFQGADEKIVQALARGDLAGAPVSDADKLRAVGWSEEQIAEAVYVIATFAFFNRVADAFGIEPMGYLQADPMSP